MAGLLLSLNINSGGKNGVDHDKVLLPLILMMREDG